MAARPYRQRRPEPTASAACSLAIAWTAASRCPRAAATAGWQYEVRDLLHDRDHERDERGAERALSGGVITDDPFNGFSQSL
jgi:hypothetical protein